MRRFLLSLNSRNEMYVHTCGRLPVVHFHHQQQQQDAPAAPSLPVLPHTENNQARIIVFIVIIGITSVPLPLV